MHTVRVAENACPLRTLGGALTDWTTKSGPIPIPTLSPARALLLSNSSARALSGSTMAPRRYSPSPCE
ncbi:hypothetical protein DAT35_05545 [Vitiosangium sp. GDMCC 1.1324]|nr:hypothetical protein DAT35_05545 [Vitiosangium sp. GDMCC 1.1324]